MTDAEKVVENLVGGSDDDKAQADDKAKAKEPEKKDAKPPASKSPKSNQQKAKAKEPVAKGKTRVQFTEVHNTPTHKFVPGACFDFDTEEAKELIKSGVCKKAK